MKKGDIFEGKVIRTEFPNKGIIDIEGQKVIVKNALEGQVVRFSINKKKRDKIEGRLLEVIEPSPIEQPAACKTKQQIKTRGSVPPFVIMRMSEEKLQDSGKHRYYKNQLIQSSFRQLHHQPPPVQPWQILSAACEAIA